jgi:hypothetical protein
MIYDHKVVTSVPSSDEGLEAVLDEYGKQGYRFAGIFYDKIFMVKEMADPAEVAASQKSSRAPEKKAK